MNDDSTKFKQFGASWSQQVSDVGIQSAGMQDWIEHLQEADQL